MGRSFPSQVQLRSLQLPPAEAEQVGLLVGDLEAVDLPASGEGGDDSSQQQLSGTKERPAQPVTGTFIGMRVGSSTLFSPEFAPPFSIIFTDSSCPLGLLQQQLGPLAECMSRAEADAVAAAMNDRAAVGNPAQQIPREAVEDEVLKEQQQGQHHGPRLQGMQEEGHPLVKAFSAPWIDPLQLEDSTAESPDEGSGAESPVYGPAGGLLPAGHRESSTFGSRTDSQGTASGAKVGMPPPSRDYTVLFRSTSTSSSRRQQPHERQLRSAVTAIHLPQPAELKAFYRSASAVAVTPLPVNGSNIVGEHQDPTTSGKLHVLRRLLKQRQHQRKQQRITVSSWSPRCVLSLPLLARIGAFFSHNEPPSGDAERGSERGQVAQGDTVISRLPGESTPSTGSTSTAAAGPPDAEGRTSSPAGEERLLTTPLPRSHPGRSSSSGSSHTRCRTELSRSSSTGGAALGGKMEHWAFRRSSSETSHTSRSSSICISGSQGASKVVLTPAMSADGDIRQFGSKALDVCRSSFASAQRFAAALSSRGSRQLQQKLQAEHARSKERGDKSSSDSGSDRSSEVSFGGSNRRTGRIPSDSRRVLDHSAASAAPQLLALPPLQLASMEASLQLHEASVLLPVDGSSSTSGSVLLHGSVDLRRRTDAVEDPLAPGGISNDAAAAERLYTQTRRCGTGGGGRTSLAGELGTSLFAAVEKADTQQQQHGPRWQGLINCLGALEDRFCPGLRAVDFALQRAAITCLRNSGSLQRLEASAAELHRRRKQLELRHSRRLRRSGSSSSSIPANGSAAAANGAEKAARGAKHVVPEGMALTAAMAEVAAYRSSMDPVGGLHRRSAAGSSGRGAHCGAFNGRHVDDGLSGASAAAASLAAETGAAAKDAQSNERVICSDLRAQLAYFFLPPTAPCDRQTHGSLVAAEGLPASQASANSGAEVGGDGRPRQLHTQGSHGSCCCCLMEGTGCSSAAARAGLRDWPCDCCCHHPQDYTALHLSQCELELSYLDCLLICRCAGEQTRQLEEQQLRQQRQQLGMLQLLNRKMALQQQLILQQNPNHWQQQGGSDQQHGASTTAHYARLVHSSAVMPTEVNVADRRSSAPEAGTAPVVAAPAAHAAPSPDVHQGPPAYPRQRHVFAFLPLLRVTLLNDHLDCLQAPLLQMLILRCRLSRACSVLPPLPVGPRGRYLQQQEQQQSQVATVNLVEASLRLWALNPLAVAFEPVVESLPLSLVVREAPYPLMRYAYTATADDDGLALGATHPVSSSSSRFQHQRSSSSSLLRQRTDAVATRESSPARAGHVAYEWVSNCSSSRSSSTEDDSAAATTPVLFRFDRSAADIEASAFHHQQRHGLSHAAVAYRLPAPGSGVSIGRTSENLRKPRREISKSSTNSGTLQGSPAPTAKTLSHTRASDGAATDHSAPPPDAAALALRYMGVLLSCPKAGSIEVNLSPLLLQSVLGSLCRWQCDFAHHMQQQQPSATSRSSKTDAGTRHARLQDSALGEREDPVTPNDYQQNLQRGVSAQHSGGQHHGVALPTAEQELQHAGGGIPGEREHSLIAPGEVNGRLERRPSRSLGSPSPTSSPSPERYTGKLFSLGGHSQRAASASLSPEAAAAVTLPVKQQLQEQRPLQEAAGPKRGKLFIPYHIVNQTGLQLGVLLLPPAAAVPAPDVNGTRIDGAKHTAVAAQYGLPATLRLCRRHNISRGAEELGSSSEDSSSSTSEAAMRRGLAAAPIYWDFGPALKRVPTAPAAAASAGVGASGSKLTVSCPPSPSNQREATCLKRHLYAPADAARWDWLQPSEERALRQTRVAIGAAAAVHVALQLADRSLGGTNAQHSVAEAAASGTSLRGDAGATNEGGGASCRRWRLRLPVPLDRVGVYIQPLTDAKLMPAPGATSASRGPHKETAPFVVCRLVADAGTKRLLVQSQVVLRSSCSSPLDVLILPSHDAPSLGPQEHQRRPRVDTEEDCKLHCLQLNPGDSTAVPVDRKSRARSCPAPALTALSHMNGIRQVYQQTGFCCNGSPLSRRTATSFAVLLFAAILLVQFASQEGSEFDQCRPGLCTPGPGTSALACFGGLRRGHNSSGLGYLRPARPEETPSRGSCRSLTYCAVVH